MKSEEHLLLLTPPLVQTNCPYAATLHLTGYLRSLGLAVDQRDLSVKVVLDVLRDNGDETTDELLEILQNTALPPEAKREAGRVIDELALRIRDEIDPEFGFSRYAERLSASAASFAEVERLVCREGVLDEPLERHLEEALAETHPTIVGLTCPFPGTLVGAFKVARLLRKRHPEIRTVLGGGFVSTELREMTDRRPRKYFDEIILDEGYAPLARLMGVKSPSVPAFVRPSYDGIDFGEYFDVVETGNPMHVLWSSRRWLRLTMARGCYWHKCAFCDVTLPYIGCFEQPNAKDVVDAMVALAEHHEPCFHFVDEALPPALVRAVCEEILRRGFECEWWGNIRFDQAYATELAALMAKAGCIAVTGGLECANDRLLTLMNKGITLETAKKVLKRFRKAGVMAHAYLMYGFPTETEKEALGALEFVRDLFREGLLQSAFWHRFALTVHSPVAARPERFGIVVEKGPDRRRKVFCRNEIGFEEPNAPDWETIGKALKLALYNYMEGRGLGKSVTFWKHAAKFGK